MEYRNRMSRRERAKQFMPFSALKGYYEALREKEKIIVPKKEISEEWAEILNHKLHQIHQKDMITVVYFCKTEYLEITGMVARIDKTARVLKVVNTKILFDDIYDIREVERQQDERFAEYRD